MMPAIKNTDTICAPATAVGGALAIIRVSGPQALNVVSALCSVYCSAAAANTVHYTRLITPPPVGGGRGETLDEVLVTIFRALTAIPAKTP